MQSLQVKVKNAVKFNIIYHNTDFIASITCETFVMDSLGLSFMPCQTKNNKRKKESFII